MIQFVVLTCTSLYLSFSYGILLWSLVTGKQPYPSKAIIIIVFLSLFFYFTLPLITHYRIAQHIISFSLISFSFFSFLFLPDDKWHKDGRIYIFACLLIYMCGHIHHGVCWFWTVTYVYFLCIWTRNDLMNFSSELDGE